MNVITCGALLCLHVDAISNDKRIVFGTCLLLSGLGTLLMLMLMLMLNMQVLSWRRSS